MQEHDAVSSVRAVAVQSSPPWPHRWRLQLPGAWLALPAELWPEVAELALRPRQNCQKTIYRDEKLAKCMMYMRLGIGDVNWTARNVCIDITYICILYIYIYVNAYVIHTKFGSKGFPWETWGPDREGVVGFALRRRPSVQDSGAGLRPLFHDRPCNEVLEGMD